MTCAKVVVKAILTTVAGNEYHGENSCRKPQATCPRLPGEGYDKCRDVCDQQHHAEGAAIHAALDAGDAVDGGHMVVYHRHVCDGCQLQMRSLNITWEIKG